MKKIILCACLSSFLLPVAADERPRLVVGIVISHFHPEWLEWYGAELSAGGFRRATGGQAWTMDYNYFYSQTGVDHASIYTGMLPADHGIISHAWHDRLRKGRQPAVASPEYLEVGSRGAGDIKSLSPRFLQAISLGSALKMSDATSKVFSIAMNGEEAVLSGGNSADLAIWYSEETGEWVSSTFYAGQLPAWLSRFNYTIDSDLFVNKGWAPLSREKNGIARFTRRAAPSSFYYDIARARRQYNTYRVLKATPHANTLVGALAGALVDGEQLGKDNVPDLLALNFSCLDYTYRDFAVDSPENKDVVLRLDQDLATLFATLDTRVGKGNYTVFLTFSEARELLPPELERLKVNSEYFAISRAVALMKSYLGLLYGPGDWIIDHDAAQVYLNRDLIAERGLNPREVQDRAADMMIDFEGISKVMTAHALASATSSSGANRLVQNSFYHKRSGDLLFCLQPTWTAELKELEDTHARYSRRSTVPLYLWGAGVPAGGGGRHDMADLLPTLCRILGLPVPYTARGNELF
ncbi:MAG: alkaline phosphatase family protein [Odoribacteraceae bacterium]|nr:alkaline phosphatase family protein [Odoribacteraceae bacterium]